MHAHSHFFTNSFFPCVTCCRCCRTQLVDGRVDLEKVTRIVVPANNDTHPVAQDLEDGREGLLDWQVSLHCMTATHDT